MRTPEVDGRDRRSPLPCEMRVLLALDLSPEGTPGGIEGVVACRAAGGSDGDSYRRAYLDASRPLLQAAWATDAMRARKKLGLMRRYPSIPERIEAELFARCGHAVQ